jgi:hypothetical protein
MNLIEALQLEIERVKEIVEVYDSLPNNAGLFASTMMKTSIKKAEMNIQFVDTVGMIQSLNDLKSYEL